jgi:hypothetical protein
MQGGFGTIEAKWLQVLMKVSLGNALAEAGGTASREWAYHPPAWTRHRDCSHYGIIVFKTAQL